MNRLLQGIKKLFKTGFFHIFGANVINKVLAFLSNIILLHIISKAEYGVSAVSARNLARKYLFRRKFSGDSLPTQADWLDYLQA